MMVICLFVKLDIKEVYTCMNQAKPTHQQTHNLDTKKNE